MPKCLAILDELRVDGDTGHRADLHALRLIKMTHAFGALVRVDLVDLGPQKNGLIRALGLADITIDALVGDDQSHGLPSTSVTRITLLAHMVGIIRALPIA